MEERHGGLSVLLVAHPATLQRFIEEHKAHLAAHAEALNVDLDATAGKRWPSCGAFVLRLRRRLRCCSRR